jgi:hypothetical protein
VERVATVVGGRGLGHISNGYKCDCWDTWDLVLSFLFFSFLFFPFSSKQVRKKIMGK